MACLPKNRYKYYRDQFIQLVGAKNAKDFTIKKVNEILNSKAPRWFFNKGIEDDTECALKTLMYSYVKSMETKKDGSKTFFKDGRINEIANQLFNIKMDKESVGRFMAGITGELVSEKLVNDSSKKIEKPVEKKVEEPKNEEPTQNPEPQNPEPQKQNSMTDEEIAGKVIYSTFPCSNLFNNSMITGSAILKKDIDTIVVYSDNEEAQNKVKSVAESKGISVYVNPSKDDLKKAIKDHSKIGIIKSPEKSEVDVDEIFKNENVKFKESINQNYKFIPCNDLILYQRKIQYLYNKLKTVDTPKEFVMKRVLEFVNMDLGNEKDPRKFDLLLRLVEDFQNISSLVVVDEKVEEDIDEYSGNQEDDQLWSAQHSTSTMPKDEILGSLLKSFATGEIDELGTPICYDPMVINNILCNIISGAKDSEEMIERLRQNQGKKKFIAPLIENIETEVTGRLKHILFTKYANLYKSNYITFNDGKIINEDSSLASTSVNLGYCKKAVEGDYIFAQNWNPNDKRIENEIEGLFRYTTIDEHPDKTAVFAMRSAGLPDDVIAQKLGIRDVYSPDNLGPLMYYMSQAGIELTSDHDLTALNREELTQLRDNLEKLYWSRRTQTNYELTSPQKFIENNKNLYSNIVDILNTLVPMKTESIVRTAGEAQFIYANKTYIDGMMDGLLKDRENYIKENFLDVEFFTSNSGKDYRKASQGIYNPLIRELALSENNEWFKCYTLFVKKENSKKPKKYSDLTNEELRELNIDMFWREREFNSQRAANGERQYCLVHAPIYSDKSTLHYYRVPIVDVHSNRNEPTNTFETPEIITEIKNLILQETNRIKTCKERAKLIKEGKIQPLSRYDTVGDKKGNGERYMFLPDLNETDKNGKTFYEKMSKASAKDKEALLDYTATHIFMKMLETDIDDMRGLDFNMLKSLALSKDWDGYNKILDEQQGKTAVDKESITDKITRLSSQFMHTSSILQLTVTDPAYYKNDGGIDIQKRYAEVMAGYQRPDLSSKYARKTMRSIFLKDCEISLPKEKLEEIRNFLTKAKEEADIDIDVDGIMRSFESINVADAQSYRTLSSYRAVRDMFGQWSSKDEELYEKLKSGQALTKDDYGQVWQTLKPFVYTQQNQRWIDSKGKERKIKIGYQYKNSEAVLFYLYNLFGDPKTKTVLTELNRFMEDYQIDTAQFESAVKVGNQGLIDLNTIAPEDVYKHLEEVTGVKEDQKIPCVGTDASGNILPGNPNVIHEIPYSEYGIKTSTPPHLFDEEEQLGSQTKKLIQGDIPDGAKIYVDTDGLFTDDTTSVTVNGEKIQLQKDENGKTYLDKEGFLNLYNGLLSDMILDNYKDVQKIFKSKENLSDELQSLMGSSPKYDFDIKQACKVRNGKFVVNLKNPNIKDKLTALISSVLKNHVNKQLVRGGTAIQMTCWGGNDLNIVRDENGAIQYMECYMPAYSKSFVESMIKEDGTLDVNKAKDKNLLNGLCYRIPTEDLYSTIPLKIKGFLPLQFGTNIMLPQEITTLTGSDFDVDKMYLILPDFEMKERFKIDKERAMRLFKKSSLTNMAHYEAMNEITLANKKRYSDGKPELTKEEEDKIKRNKTKDYFKAFCLQEGYIEMIPRYIRFDSSKDISENSHAQKSNLLLQLMRGCISSPCNITKNQNPGGFDYLKDIVKENNLDVQQPMNMTETQYFNFNRLNMVARKLIGIYANHNAAHALVQGSGLTLTEEFTVDWNTYKSLDRTTDDNKRRISRNLCEFLAAAPDNAKDPVLAKLWQNTNTAGATCFMLRLGVPTKTIIKMFKNAKEKYADDFEKFMTEGVLAFKGGDYSFRANNMHIDSNNPYALFDMLGHYADTIRNLETLNQILKADSTNGAMFTLSDIIKNITSVKRMREDTNIAGLENLIPEFKENGNLLNMSKSEIKEAIGGNPKSYQVAYYLTFANFKKYYEDVLDKNLVDELIKIGEQVPRFSEENISSFVNEYTKTQIRYLDYFKPKVTYKDGKYTIVSTQDIIDNTIKTIPEKFAEYKSKYPDNMFIKSLDLITDKRGKLLCVRNIADLRPETINEIKAGFYNLYNNAVSFNDANDLIHYTLATDGFRYSPTSFLSVIPVEILDKMPGMNDIFNYFEIENIERFEDEYILKTGLIEYDKDKNVKSNYIYRKSDSRFIKNGSAYYKKNMNTPKDPKLGYKYEIFARDVEDPMTGDKSIVYMNSEKNYDKSIDEIVSDLVVDKDPNRIREIVNSVVENLPNGADINSETISKVLLENNNIGRFFSLDGNPLDNYEPISIEWC